MIQADAGTRTASVTGAWIALRRACDRLLAQGVLSQDPIRHQLAAVSVGLIDAVPLLDLDYSEDSCADVDLNVVTTGDGRLLELQGTAEQAPFSRSELDAMLNLAESGIQELMHGQRLALATDTGSRIS